MNTKNFGITVLLFTLLSGTIYIGSDHGRVSRHEFVRSCLRQNENNF